MATYFVMGGDNREYGPVSVDELRNWVAEGRADAQSKVRAEGSSEWMPLSHVPGLADAPARKAPPTLLPLHPPAPVPRTSSMAIAALILAILGCTAPLGLVLGIIAMVRVTKSRGALTGKGLALGGIIVSAVVLLMVLLTIPALLLPALAGAHDRARQIQCLNNERQLAQAVIVYANSHTNHYPPAATWCDAIRPTVSSEFVFKCPAATNSSPCDYAFNARLEGLELGRVNPQTVLLFDSDGGWNAHGGPELLAARHRRQRAVVAFADGHVEAVSPSQLNALRWNP
jgi:prepilin-type processing-associated H-X9-DG protein